MINSTFQPAYGSNRHVPPTPTCFDTSMSNDATVRSSSRWFIIRDTAPRTDTLGSGRS